VHYYCTLHHYSFSLPITQTNYAAGALSVLKQVGLGDLAVALEAVGGVHEIWNLLSLQRDPRSRFNSLDLWFDGTSNIHHLETSY